VLEARVPSSHHSPGSSRSAPDFPAILSDSPPDFPAVLAQLIGTAVFRRACVSVGGGDERGGGMQRVPREGAGPGGGVQGVRQPPEHRVVAATRAQRAPRIRRLHPRGPPGEVCFPSTFGQF
jgi:hypothetical protein